jgi:hypothetical protein
MSTMPRNGTCRGWMLIILVVAFLAMPVIASAQAKPTPAVEFVEQLERHFKAWDKDKDGKLSSKEIDDLVDEAQIKGKPAAAVAALKRADRAKKTAPLPPFTREYFQKYAKLKGPEKQTMPDFGGMYQSSLRRIEKTNRELFASELPRLDTMHQGRLGDCYFIAPVGAALYRSPEAIKNMFKKQPDGTIEVRFGAGRKVRVRPVTDAELGLTSSTDGDGVWLNTLEKAFGESRNERLPEDQQKDSTTDLIANGGSSRPIIELLTGHQARGISLRPKDKDKGHTDGELQAKLALLRPILLSAMKDKRLVCCGTPGLSESDVKVPGIPGKHAYAVLGYDVSTDELHIWNPHGNTFTPKGTKGPQFGYPTKSGRFAMPLKEFVQTFGGLSYETGEPLKPASTAKGGKGK